jgi:hypothetical protein
MGTNNGKVTNVISNNYKYGRETGLKVNSPPPEELPEEEEPKEEITESEDSSSKGTDIEVGELFETGGPEGE